MDSGINVVDVGWGGTMQEAIYGFFEQKVEVRGFYLGLNALYTITERTNRFGLNFPYCHLKIITFIF